MIGDTYVSAILGESIISESRNQNTNSSFQTTIYGDFIGSLHPISDHKDAFPNQLCWKEKHSSVEKIHHN